MRSLRKLLRNTLRSFRSLKIETFIHIEDLLDLEKRDSISYRKDFNCEEQSLNDYIQKYAKQHSREDVSQTHVLIDSGSKMIVSYYSLSAISVKKEVLVTEKRFPFTDVPGMLLGRLAVNKTFKGKGYGGHTLVEALKKIRSLSKEIGIKVVVVDALNDSAVSFYNAYGFKSFEDTPMKLFITIDEIDAL